jgi:DNA-binding NarL/FixJ family response regulator
MITTDLEGIVEDAAAHLYVWALKDIPQDLRDALADAAERETSVPGRRVLSTILRNVQIAEKLVVSVKTVDHHVGAILRKLGVRTRGEAVAEAARLGLR